MKLDGIWNSDVQITYKEKVSTVPMNMTFGVIGDSSGLLMNETYQHSSLGSVEGFSLIGYDENLNQLTWYYLDNKKNCHLQIL